MGFTGRVQRLPRAAVQRMRTIIARRIGQALKGRRAAGALHGEPCSAVEYPLWLVHDLASWGKLGAYVA